MTGSFSSGAFGELDDAGEVGCWLDTHHGHDATSWHEFGDSGCADRREPGV